MQKRFSPAALVGATLLAVASAATTARADTSPTSAEAAPPAAPTPVAVGVRCVVKPPELMRIRLVPTANANGSAGEVKLTFAPSPFGVTLTRDGHHVLALDIKVQGLRLPEGTEAVIWVTTPDLGTVIKLGPLAANGTLQGRVSLNKFLVFLTAEPSPEVERWSGPVLLRGSSPSGRMHSMAGHGPFEGEPCAVVGF